MSKYIDRNELLKTINENVAEAHNERCSQLLEAILNAPTANVVEVVRCKDCKFCSRIVGENRAICCHHTSGLCDIDYKKDYCSYGERRENEFIKRS